MVYYGHMTTNRNEIRNYLRAVAWRAVRIFKASHGCADCGITNPIVLELDHVSDDKRSNVSDLIRSDYGWSTIVTEVHKCEVVCRNCHAIRTESRKTSTIPTRPHGLPPRNGR